MNAASISDRVQSAIRGSRFRSHGRRGFTLVELVVVIAILTVLLLLMLPAAQVGIGEARRVQCLHNLRQMVVAANCYAAMHGGRYPPAFVRDLDAGVTHTWDMYEEDGVVKPGLLWDGNGNMAVQQCPEYHGSANWDGNPYTGYNYNSSFIGGAYYQRNNMFLASSRPSASVGSVRKPSQCALFGDGEWAGGANKFMRSPYEGALDAGFSGRAAGTQGLRHRGRTNVAFCDGHAVSLAAAYSNTYAFAVSQLTPGTGFLSADNALYDLE